jgi:hypothetical protein
MTVRRVAKAGASLLFVAGVLAGGASVASAAEPSPPSCVGESFSALAGQGFGQGVRSFAQAPDKPGLGDGIQALQAGVVPDEVVPNTCN